MKDDLEKISIEEATRLINDSEMDDLVKAEEYISDVDDMLSSLKNAPDLEPLLDQNKYKDVLNQKQKQKQKSSQKNNANPSLTLKHKMEKGK